MILRQYQQALGKPLFALLTVTLLAMSGCSDEPQDTSRVDSNQNSTANRTVQTAETPTEVESEPTGDTAAGVSSQTDTTVVATDEGANAENIEATNMTNNAATSDQPDAALSAEAGKELYEKQCKICHESGLLNAPKYGDKAAWQPHISKGMATLYEHSAKGFNKMPPQAVNGVTDAQVHAAVDYMVAGSS